MGPQIPWWIDGRRTRGSPVLPPQTNNWYNRPWGTPRDEPGGCVWGWVGGGAVWTASGLKGFGRASQRGRTGRLRLEARRTDALLRAHLGSLRSRLSVPSVTNSFFVLLRGMERAQACQSLSRTCRHLVRASIASTREDTIYTRFHTSSDWKQKTSGIEIRWAGTVPR